MPDHDDYQRATLQITLDMLSARGAEVVRHPETAHAIERIDAWLELKERSGTPLSYPQLQNLKIPFRALARAAALAETPDDGLDAMGCPAGRGAPAC